MVSCITAALSGWEKWPVLINFYPCRSGAWAVSGSVSLLIWGQLLLVELWMSVWDITWSCYFGRFAKGEQKAEWYCARLSELQNSTLVAWKVFQILRHLVLKACKTGNLKHSWGTVCVWFLTTSLHGEEQASPAFEYSVCLLCHCVTITLYLSLLV